MALETQLSTEMGTAAKQGWVLVIARQQHLRQLLLTILSQAGYTLLGCSTVDEARHTLGQHCAPRLILFDGAAESEERLREQVQQITLALPPGTHCRLIMLSLAHPQPRLQTLPGVDALIARPFDLLQVLGKVKALMQG